MSETPPSPIPPVAAPTDVRFTMTAESAPPVAASAPSLTRPTTWQFSLRDLLLATATASVCLALAAFLGRDLMRDVGRQFAELLGVGILAGTVPLALATSYLSRRWSMWRAGPARMRVARPVGAQSYLVQTGMAFAAAVAYFYVMRSILGGTGPAGLGIVLLAIFATNGLVSLVSREMILAEKGVMAATVLGGWQFSRWRRLRPLRWRDGGQCQMLVGSHWHTLFVVSPEERPAVEALLQEKTGATAWGAAIRDADALRHR